MDAEAKHISHRQREVRRGKPRAAAGGAVRLHVRQHGQRRRCIGLVATQELHKDASPVQRGQPYNSPSNIMRCFYHRDLDAVGTCKSCQRGLCHECAVDLDKGLACRGHCEEDVQNLIRLIQNNLRLSPVSSSLIRAGRRGGMLAAGFSLTMGIMFVVWGLYNSRLFFFIAMGALFIVYGLLQMVRISRLAVVPKDLTQPE